MKIQTFRRARYCYTTRDNSEVTLRHAVVVVPVSTYTHQLCIHTYCDFRFWWMAVAWYLMDQVKYYWVLEKLATSVLCYVKSWMNVEKLRTADVD